jgi:hypothetical protein
VRSIKEYNDKVQHVALMSSSFVHVLNINYIKNIIIIITHQLLVYADDVNILRGSIHTTKKNAKALVVACKENGLEVNADTTKYTVMSRDQNAGQSHNIKTDSSSFERVDKVTGEWRKLHNEELNDLYS